MGDMQISSEYVAYAIHHISSLANGLPTSVITHSQGGPDTQWALQFWPSTRKNTRAFVALSPDFQGIELLHSSLSKICVGDLCQASVRQQSVGSTYYTALHGEDFKALVPTTSVWSQFDEVVVPARDNARLPGGTSIAVQDVCPGRVIDHIFMPIDSAGFALALDAISNDGIADAARVKKNQHRVCYRITAKNMRVDLATQLESLWDDLVNGWVYMLSLNVQTVRYLADGTLGAPRVSSEPPLKPYAQ
nr:lipase b [Quercus suber]